MARSLVRPHCTSGRRFIRSNFSSNYRINIYNRGKLRHTRHVNQIPSFTANTYANQSAPTKGCDIPEGRFIARRLRYRKAEAPKTGRILAKRTDTQQTKTAEQIRQQEGGDQKVHQKGNGQFLRSG